MDYKDTDGEPISKSGLQPTLLPDKFKGLKERVASQPKVRDVYPQIIASCIAHLLVIQAGINMAYSAILLPQLMADDSTFPISKDEASWIASLMAMATPVGALVCGPFMDLMGRKMFSLVTTVPIILSWFLLVLIPNYIGVLYVARVLAGFGGGLTTVSLVYISEISNASWRPMLLCLNSVFVSLGILLTNALGVLLPWRIVAMLAGCLSIATAVAIFFYNPESPYWLLTFQPNSDKAYEQAKQSLRSLNPNQQLFSKEWDRLLTISQASQQKKEEGQVLGVADKIKITAVEFSKQSSFLPLTLLVTIFFFQQLSGTYPIVFYAVQIFQSIGGNFGAGLNEDSATILLGVIRFVTSLLTAGLSHKFGRRPLLIFSGVGMTVSGFAAAVYFHKTPVFKSVFNKDATLNSTTVFNFTNSVNDSVDLITTRLPYSEIEDGLSRIIGVVCILLFVFMSSIGFLIIPWTLIGEILPMSIRGVGGGLIISYAYILMFLVVKAFPFMLDIFHISGLFYFFSFTSLVNVLVVCLFLPETLGKSFEEIEKYFSKQSVRR